MPDGVDAAPERQQRSAPYAGLDRARRDAQPDQLEPRDDAVLA
jgi:hypothetical protein